MLKIMNKGQGAIPEHAKKKLRNNGMTSWSEQLVSQRESHLPTSQTLNEDSITL